MHLLLNSIFSAFPLLTGKLPTPIRFLLISFVSFVFSSYLSFILSSRLEDQCFSIIQSQQGACHSPAPLYPYHHQSLLFLKSLLVSSLSSGFFPFLCAHWIFCVIWLSMIFILMQLINFFAHFLTEFTMLLPLVFNCRLECSLFLFTPGMSVPPLYPFPSSFLLFLCI